MSPLPDLVVGALLALLGVLVSQLVAMLQARLERHNKREVLLRTKYEELGAHFLDSMKLPHALMTCTSTEDILVLTHQASGNNAHLLALLYFPLLRQATGQYIDSYSALLMTATSLHNPKETTGDRPRFLCGSCLTLHSSGTAQRSQGSSPTSLALKHLMLA